MHILIIPSEEFQPANSHLAGIFQRHQCTAMHLAGWHVSVLSVRLQFSRVMVFKGILTRLIGRVPGRGLEKYSIPELFGLLNDKWRHPERFVTAEVIDGYAVVRINGLYLSRPSPEFDHISWVRAGRVAFAEFCRRHGKPDLIHVHNCNPAGLLASAIHRETGIPYVITEHSSYYHRQLIPARLLPRLRAAFAAARVLAVVSPGLGTDLARDAGPQAAGARWIPNVIDPEFEACGPCEPCHSAGFVLLSVGELIPLKGHRELIAAFSQAFSGQPEVTLRIAGNGVLDGELRAQAKALGIDAQVKFLGRLDRKQVLQEMKACHCLVLPSHYETFGVVLIEALATGRPVIATRCGGPNCIVDDSNGLLVPPRDVSALANALIAMKRNHSQYTGTAIQKDVLVRFGRQRLLRDLEQAYQDCLS